MIFCFFVSSFCLLLFDFFLFVFLSLFLWCFYLSVVVFCLVMLGLLFCFVVFGLMFWFGLFCMTWGFFGFFLSFCVLSLSRVGFLLFVFDFWLFMLFLALCSWFLSLFCFYGFVSYWFLFLFILFLPLHVCDLCLFVLFFFYGSMGYLFATLCPFFIFMWLFLFLCIQLLHLSIQLFPLRVWFFPLCVVFSLLWILSFGCHLIASGHSTRSFLILTQLSSDSAEGGRRVAAGADSDWLALWPLPCRWTDRVSVHRACSRRPVVLGFLLLGSAPSRRASLSSDVSLQLYKRVIQSVLMGVYIRPEPGLGRCKHLT